MIVAAIDVGSNTLRLLIAEVNNGKIVKILHEDRKITRLAENLIYSHKLNDAAIDRTIKALKTFKDICDRFRPHKIKIVATSAGREAENSNVFLNKAKEIGFDIELIDGTKEGYYTYLGVASVVKISDKKCVIFDIGGGSTEFIYTENGAITHINSIAMGVVKIANTFDLNHIVDGHTKDGMCAFIKEHLQRLNSSINPDLIIGTAGTVTTIAAIDLALDKYNSTFINNYKLEYEHIEKIYEKLAHLPACKRLKIKGLEAGREDLIIGGTLMVLEILEYFSKNFLIVSDYGLREGLAIAANLD